MLKRKFHYFLGIVVIYCSDGMYITQAKYAKEVVTRAKMENARPVRLPMSAKDK